ncbi:hypothetical protein Smar_0964 [Staphylothermus marinus F1]|uniref:Uncharacterized protein n=1 Tax=Staphylothermus marinus (strain ATCC 43588 / DSM 3639 / JCM 9404 / F1) TaxID=399550 RepID=A3DN53_STAMF|nr:hypothetical protein [Staphylothermus marinus]ABN70063.1 hypothetical protein Smar_0964 [Staphylothermus marinus F1]
MGSYDEHGFKVLRVFQAKARIGQVLNGASHLVLKPEDLSSPVAFQMAITRIMDTLMKSLQEGPKRRYVAEIRFKDSMGNPVVIAVDLGESPPPFSSKEVKARIIVELYEEEQGTGGLEEYT